jgi:hypothetical protein
MHVRLTDQPQRASGDRRFGRTRVWLRGAALQTSVLHPAPERLPSLSFLFFLIGLELPRKTSDSFPHSPQAYSHPLPIKRGEVRNSLASIFYFDQQRCQHEMNANESLACSGVAMDVRQGFLIRPFRDLAKISLDQNLFPEIRSVRFSLSCLRYSYVMQPTVPLHRATVDVKDGR